MMRIIALLAFAVGSLASLAVEAATVQYRIANSPTNAFSQGGGLTGHQIFAGIEGTFAITYGETGAPVLSALELILVNVSESTGLPGFDAAAFEGKPIQNFMPHDLAGSSAADYVAGAFVHFAAPLEAWPPYTIITAPFSSFRLDRPDDQPTVYLSTMLAPLATLDVPVVRFEPLAATVIPEPTTLALAATAATCFAARRRKDSRRVAAT